MAKIHFLCHLQTFPNRRQIVYNCAVFVNLITHHFCNILAPKKSHFICGNKKTVEDCFFDFFFFIKYRLIGFFEKNSIIIVNYNFKAFLKKMEVSLNELNSFLSHAQTTQGLSIQSFFNFHGRGGLQLILNPCFFLGQINCFNIMEAILYILSISICRPH